MPASIKLQAEYGDDLQVIFVESQGATAEVAEAFSLKMKWLGGKSMWTTERPVNSSSGSLPHCALLDASGKVVLTGNPLALHKEIEETLQTARKQMQKGPEDVPRDVAKAWKDFSKGKLGAALTAAEKLAESQDEAIARSAAEALTAFRARIDAEISRAARLLEGGYYQDAEDLLDDLVKETKGLERYAESVAEVQAHLEDKELEAERSAEKKLLRLERQLFSEGMEEGILRQLEKLAEKETGTKAAERARHWVSLAEASTP